MIDLRHNYPVLREQRTALTECLKRRSDVLGMDALRLPPWTGRVQDCKAMASWFGLLGRQTILCSGGNHALAVAAMALNLAGKVVITDEFTYGTFISIASLMGIQLLACRGDAHGMLPCDLESLCIATGRVAGLFIQPTIQNPTCVTMPADRRYEIAQIVVRRGLVVIEDDAYRFLDGSPPPSLAQLLPDHTVGIHSLSKIYSPSLKVSCVQIPLSLKPVFETYVRLTTSGASQLLVALAVDLMRDGTLDALISLKRIEATRRQAIARDALQGIHWMTHDTAFHGWVQVPREHHADDVRDSLQKQGIDVSSGTEFAAPGIDGNRWLRFSTGAEDDAGRLSHGLKSLCHALIGEPAQRATPLELHNA